MGLRVMQFVIRKCARRGYAFVEMEKIAPHAESSALFGENHACTAAASSRRTGAAAAPPWKLS
jgi:hypothetical protein